VAITQLPALKPGTKLVTLTVGAANLDLSGLLADCTQTPTSCHDEIIERLAQLPQLGIDLTDLYAEVADEAPKALIVVTGYPHLFERVNPLFAEINAAIDQLNTTIQQAVDAADPTGENIVYVDVTAAFAGHGIGSTTPFINALPSADAFHPNAAGYAAYADVILAELDEQAQLL
jgi:lysophospholipase L1-like esterase